MAACWLGNLFRTWIAMDNFSIYISIRGTEVVCHLHYKSHKQLAVHSVFHLWWNLCMYVSL